MGLVTTFYIEFSHSKVCEKILQFEFARFCNELENSEVLKYVITSK